MISIKPIKQSWTFPDHNVSITKEIVDDFKIQDFLAVDFLIQSYFKKLQGVILNEDDNFNIYLQITGFLSAVYPTGNGLILIVCPDDHISRWHYFFSKSNSFNCYIVQHDCSTQQFNGSGSVLLLAFSKVKLATNFEEFFFSVVIDNFDLVATKLVLRRIEGCFKIGVTARNFCVTPDQKLQWNMLNWTNPDCFSKQKEFRQFDDENFANMCDNYKEWWLRLTWNFSEDFIKPSEIDEQDFYEVLRKWEDEHNIHVFEKKKNNKKKKLCKRIFEFDSGSESKKKKLNVESQQIPNPELKITQVEVPNKIQNDTVSVIERPLIPAIQTNEDMETDFVSNLYNSDFDENKIFSLLVQGKENDNLISNKDCQNREHTLSYIDDSDAFLKNMVSKNINKPLINNISYSVINSEENALIRSIVNEPSSNTIINSSCSNDNDVDNDQLIEDVYEMVKRM